MTTASAPAPEAVRQHYRVTLAILVFSSMAYGLQQTLVAPALPAIQKDLDVSTTAVTYVLTAFLLSASVSTPIIGRLGDMFGKKRMLVATLVLFGIGSLVSALSTSIELLIAGRIIQGAAGAIFPLAFGIVRDEFPREKVAGGIGLVSAMIGIGGATGVVFSGVIVDNLGYEWVFWIGLAFTSLTVVLTALYIPESPIKVPAKVDWGGAALLAGGMVALLVAVSEGNSWGWLGTRTVGLFTLAGLLLVFWVAYEKRHPAPLVDMAMMSHRSVFTTNLAAVLIGFGMYSSFILFPQFVQTPGEAGYGFGSSVTEAGLFLLPNAGAMLIAGPMTGLVTRHRGSRFALLIGTLLVLSSFVFLAFWHSDPWMVLAVSFVSGLGTGFAFSAMPNLIIEVVEPSQTGVATGMNAIMRTVGGAIGGQVAAAVLTGYMAASGFPREAGYTLTFVLLAMALGLALLCVLAIPRPVRVGARPEPTPDPLLAGRVVRGTARVPAAVLTVLGTDGREVAHVRADDSGSFFLPLPAGRYFVIATDAGRSPAAVTLDLPATSAQIEIQLASWAPTVEPAPQWSALREGSHSGLVRRS